LGINTTRVLRNTPPIEAKLQLQIVRWAAFVVSGLILVGAGCRTAPVRDILDAPVVASKPNPSADEVGKAIQRAGTRLGWQMRQTKPGHVLGTLYLGRHVAVVDIPYTANSYSIVYKDSLELNYDGIRIHSNYNIWIQDLDKAIKAQLNNL
jgi:hypothetical protein